MSAFTLGFDRVVRVQAKVLGRRPGALLKEHVPVLPELRGARPPHDRVREGGQGSNPNLNRCHRKPSLSLLARRWLEVCRNAVCVGSDPSTWRGRHSEQQ